MSRPLHAWIDREALSANLTVARGHTPRSRLMAVIKADGYGHGLIRVAGALQNADALAVASLEEAMRLREAGIRKPILLLEGFFQAEELPLVVAHHLETVVHSPHQIQQLRETLLPRLPPVWIKLDSGMNRLGFPPEDLPWVWEQLTELELPAPPRLMTHLACADQPGNSLTRQQLSLFAQAVEHFATERSIANSAGLLAWPDSRVEWVRPGIMLYGASPFAEREAREFGLRPAMYLRSALIAVKTCPRGSHVGYGATWRCPENMRIGVVAAGYGDGYPRHAPAGTPVSVNGRIATLVGRVSMDMLTVDLREHPEAQPGDPVVLWGDEPSVDCVARHAGTIGYELLTQVTHRVMRVAK